MESLNRSIIPLRFFNRFASLLLKVFGLIRDPGAENNWKIKQTEARLVGGQMVEMPSVHNSKLEAVTYC